MALILLTTETETLFNEGCEVAGFVIVAGNLNEISWPLLKAPDNRSTTRTPLDTLAAAVNSAWLSDWNETASEDKLCGELPIRLITMDEPGEMSQKGEIEATNDAKVAPLPRQSRLIAAFSLPSTIGCIVPVKLSHRTVP
jgi:hypothetical protein